MWAKALLICLLCFSSLVHAQLPGKPKAKAVASDLKFIQCEVCKQLAKNAYRQVRELRRNQKKVSEVDILDLLEKVTSVDEVEGAWVTKLDLQEKGGVLEVVDMGQEGKCGSECATVKRAADKVLADHDMAFAEKLWKAELALAKLQHWLCYEETSVCSKKPPKLPASRAPGPAFEPADKQELDLARMMAKMKASGMGGQLYDRDSIQQQLRDMEDEGDFDFDPKDEGAWKEPAPASRLESLGAAAEKVKEQASDALSNLAKSGQEMAEKARSTIASTTADLKDRFEKITGSKKTEL